MTRIDDILIQRVFSPAAGWVEHRLGLSQWRLALECLNGSVAFYLAAVAFTIARKGLNDAIFADLLAGVAWLMIMEFVRRVTLNQAGSSLGAQTARMREWIFRFALLAALPVSLIHVRDLGSFCYSASLLLLAAHLYFKASDAPPPQRRPRLARALC